MAASGPSLSEAQIQRYSRQILLKEVGGTGQLRLLGAAVEVWGEGSALDVAAAYLAAGGSPVRVRGVWLQGFDPERSPQAPVGLTVGEGPAPAAQLRLCLEVGAARIVYRPAGGCAACFERQGPGVAAWTWHAPVVVGTLAALVGQQLLLGQRTSVGALRIDPAGTCAPVPVTPCEACARAAR